MNARFSDYISIFFVDIILIASFMFGLLALRQAELHILVKLGVYKNVEDLTDKEIISEYNKLKKQSLKLQNRLKKASSDNSMDAKKAKKAVRLMSGATDRQSDKQDTQDTE